MSEPLGERLGPRQADERDLRGRQSRTQRAEGGDGAEEVAELQGPQNHYAFKERLSEQGGVAPVVADTLHEVLPGSACRRVSPRTRHLWARPGTPRYTVA